MPHPDTALIVRCQARDPAAFDDVVALYQQKIFHYVYRMVGNADEADDITQDVFVKIYLALPTFRSEASLATWLYRIASNLCIDRHRKEKRRGAALGGEAISLEREGGAPDDEIGLDLPDTAAEPLRRLQQAEMDSAIQAALARLPEKMRAVVVLHDIEGLAYEEIAAAVHCPLGTVKSRLFNARLQLRQMLTPYMQE